GALGAEVIKVESRQRPDRTRAMGPVIGAAQPNGSSMTYSLLNYSKLGCSINTSTAEGRLLERRLVDAADVVIENFSTGVAERLGLDYDALAADHPGLVMVSCSGLGRT